jgi:signal transduction histidine kinase/PAS domain-containing protein
LLDNLDGLPDEVLRLLASEFRLLRDDMLSGEFRAGLRVVFFGAMKLHYLSAGDLSPLSGVVDKIDLQDLSPEQVAAAFPFRNSGPIPDEEVMRLLVAETSGHPHLVQVLGAQLVGREVSAESILAAAKSWSAKCVEGRDSDPCFQDIVASLERDPRAFDVVRRLLEHSEPAPRPHGAADLAVMSGAVSSQGEAFAFRGRMLERALGRYLDAVRKGDYCCLHGDWEQAQEYYSQVAASSLRQRRNVRFGTSKRTLMDLYRGLEQRLTQFHFLREAEEFVAATGKCFFGADKTTLWRHLPGQASAEPVVLTDDAVAPSDESSKLAAAATRNHTAFTLRGNLGVVQGIGSDPELTRWAFQLEYADGLPEGWVGDNLRYVEPTLYSILNQARRREEGARREREQQTFVHEIVLQLQRARQVDKAFSLIVTGVTERLGYECAQLSLVFPKEGLLRAVESSGAFAKIKDRTVRDLQGPDILARIIRSRMPKIVDDCADPASDCEPESIEISRLKSQIAIPLLVDKAAIGILQVGDTRKKRAFADEDLARLQLLADAAAIAIQVAGERENLELALTAVGDAMVVVDSDDIAVSCNSEYSDVFGTRVGERAPLTRVSSTNSTPLVQLAFRRGRPLQTIREAGGRRYIVTAAGRQDAFGRYSGGVEVVDTKSPLYGLTETLSQLLELSQEEQLGQTVVDCLRTHFRYPRVRFYRADTDGSRMASAWCSGMPSRISERFHGAEFTYTRDPGEHAGDGFECLRHGAPVIVVRPQFAERDLPIGKITNDTQHRRVLVLPEEDLLFMDELDKRDVTEWMEVPVGDISSPIGKLSIDHKGRDTTFGLEDLEMMDFFSRWVVRAMTRVRDLQRAKGVSLAADDVRHLGKFAGLETVTFHFLLHVTMEGGVNLNRAAVFLRRPHSEEVVGFLCHGAANGKEFEEACKVIPEGDRRDFIERLSLAGPTEQEQERVERLRTLTISKDPFGDPLSQALAHQRTIHIKNAQVHLLKFYDLLQWEPAREAIICPLVFGGECEGLLYADRAYLVHGVGHQEDRKTLESLAIQLAAAAQSSRLADQLRHQILGLSHTTLAPMVAIKGMAEALIPSVRDDEQLRFLKLIAAEADRGADTLRRTLHLAKVSAGTLRLQTDMCDICRLLRDRIDPYCALLEADHIIVSDEISSEPIHADIDAALLGSAFAELAANALIALRMCRTSPEGRFFHFECSRTGGAICRVVFENSGPLIPVELRPRVFDAFVSGTGGTGIGLFLVARIVQLHGGVICYEVTPHQTSRFVLSIPTCASEGATR